MLEIDNNGNIKIDRGDTFEIPLFIDVNETIFKSTRFPLHQGDVIYFHITEPNTPWEFPILGKSFTYDDVNENNDILVKFNHLDTCKLPPGIYYYEIKLQRPNEPSDDNSFNDTYVTIVPSRKFVIR